MRGTGTSSYLMSVAYSVFPPLSHPFPTSSAPAGSAPVRPVRPVRPPMLDLPSKEYTYAANAMPTNSTHREPPQTALAASTEVTPARGSVSESEKESDSTSGSALEWEWVMRGSEYRADCGELRPILNVEVEELK